MRFFIPFAENKEQELQAYQAIKNYVIKVMNVAEFSDRKIRLLAFTHNRNNYRAEVGKYTTFNGEIVIAILYELSRRLYHVCTPNCGVARGLSILVGEGSVEKVEDFESDVVTLT